jgi:hypothetical protein
MRILACKCDDPDDKKMITILPNCRTLSRQNLDRAFSRFGVAPDATLTGDGVF